MALTGIGDYKNIRPPSDYEKYGMSPAPLRTGAEQRIMYWLDLLYLAEWSAAIRYVSDSDNDTPTGEPKQPVLDRTGISRALNPEVLTPAGTSFTGGSLYVPADGYSAYDDANYPIMSMLACAMYGYRYARGFWWGSLWVRPSHVGNITSLDFDVEDVTEDRVSSDLAVIRAKLLNLEIDGSIPTPLNHPEIFLSNSNYRIPVEGGFTETLALAVAGTRQGEPVRLSAMLGMFEACRLFRYCVFDLKLSDGFKTTVAERRYTRSYSSRSRNGGWKWEITGGHYLDGDIVDGPTPDGSGCQIYEGFGLRGAGSNEGASLISTTDDLGNPVGYQEIYENDEEREQSTEDVSYTSDSSGFTLFRRYLVETCALDSGKSESNSYTVDDAYQVETIAPGGVDAEGKPEPNTYRVCQNPGSSRKTWRRYVGSFSHSLTVQAESVQDDLKLRFGRIADYQYAHLGILKGNRYPSYKTNILRAVVYVSVTTELDGTGSRIHEQYTDPSSCLFSENIIVDTTWHLSASGSTSHDTNLPELDNVGTRYYSVPVDAVVEDGAVTVTVRSILDSLATKLMGEGKSGLSDGDFIYKLAHDAEDKPPALPSFAYGSEYWNKIPPVGASGQLSSNWFDQGEASSSERLDGSSCENNGSGGYSTDAIRQYGLKIDLVSNCISVLFDWNPPVCI